MVICFLVPFFSSAQIVFEKAFGGPGSDEARDVEFTADGGYIMVGATTSFGAGNASNSDIYIVKVTSTGEHEWSKTFGTTGVEVGYSIQRTTDGGYIVAGSTTSYGGGLDDVYLIKLDVNGTAEWTKTFGGGGVEVGREVKQTADGGYVIVGYSGTSAAFDIFLIKTDNKGGTEWTKMIGGSGFDVGNSIKETVDGYIIAGETSSIGSGDSDFYLVKTDISGNVKWQKAFGGMGLDEAKYVQLTSDGYIIAGDTESYGEGMSDIFILKTDTSGTEMWRKLLGGENKDVSKMIQPTPDGGYIVSGISRSFGWINPDVWVVKLKASGETDWSKNYGGYGNEHCYAAKPTPDGGYIVTGSTNTSNKEEAYLLKLNASGEITGIDAAHVSQTFSVYPNPSMGDFELSFETTDASPVVIKLYDIQGCLIYREKASPVAGILKKKLNVETSAKGIYMLEVSTNEYSIRKKVLLY